MSGDVQPRRRKDKKRKRDDRKSEGEVIFSRKQSLQDDDESSHGVHSANMGADDQHLHIHEDHGTGGNWYQKCAFVVLMAILLGLVGLIIVENRGLADLDTPLSESRYSEYLHGWVEEHREEHDDHDDVQASLEDHDEHDEPFEEEEDHSEVDEEDDDHEHDDEDDDDEDHEDDDEDHEEEDEDATKEQTKEDDADDDDEDVTAEQTEENDDDLDNEDDDEDDEQNTDNVTKEDDDDENDDDDEDVTKTAEDDDDDEDVAKTVEDEDEDDEDDATVEADDDDEDDADDDDDADENNTLEAASTEADNDENDDDDDDDDEDENNDSAAPAKSTSKGHHSKADDDDDAFDEEEDDGTAESLENIVVDNDAEEMLLLQAKERRWAAQNQPPKDDGDDEEPEVAQSFFGNQINPKQTPGGGPQAQEGDFYSIHNKLRQEQKPNIYEDDEYEREMALANDELLRGKHLSALVAFYKITYHFPDRPMGFLGKAKLLDHFGQLRGDTNLLTQSVDAYKRYLAFEELIENELQFQQAAEACIRTMHYLGQYEPALTIHRILINRFSDDPEHRNQLANTLLIMNRFLDAKVALVKTLKKWPQDGYAHVLLGYVLKMNDHQYAKAAHHLRLGLDSKAKGTQDARFYIALGDAYQRLNNPDDAHKIYKRGAELKLYPSHYQRSIFNEPNLRAQPIWGLNETTYAQHLSVIAENWQTIRYEANSMLEIGGYFRREKENLLAVGNWKELELFSRGKRNHKNCAHAPTTCWLIEQFPAAALCRRGQVKFSVMHPGTQVRPHCGPTNCRLRAHLGLIVPPGTHLRVANHRTTWVEGSFLIFDDSFEHEVWHEGDSIRLILIVDFWHPDLNAEQIERLSVV